LLAAASITTIPTAITYLKHLLSLLISLFQTKKQKKKKTIMPSVLHFVAYGATGLAFCFVVLSLGTLI
jgi:hypothetical protein